MITNLFVSLFITLICLIPVSIMVAIILVSKLIMKEPIYKGKYKFWNMLYLRKEKSMKFEINLENMKEIYGEEIIEIILANKELIKENARTLEKYKFNDIENIFERYPSLLMNFPRQFEKKIIKLKEIYGEDFVNIIENNIDILENIDK